jgi:stage II sporulation protein D
MSQNGANYMAQQGRNYKEILAHYYKGAKILKE